MTQLDLHTHYLAYLDALNERRFENLVDFVAEELTYNERLLTRADYRALLESDVAATPDLAFHVGLLVVEGDQVACRLDFDCTPGQTFLGIEPTGRRVRFSEHVFYRFRGAHIVEVSSLIDRDAIREG